jgi:hypothetical protein
MQLPVLDLRIQLPNKQAVLVRSAFRPDVTIPANNEDREAIQLLKVQLLNRPGAVFRAREGHKRTDVMGALSRGHALDRDRPRPTIE